MGIQVYPVKEGPLTTKGDLHIHNGADDARLAVGANGTVLVADSTLTNGVKWGAHGLQVVLNQNFS